MRARSHCFQRAADRDRDAFPILRFRLELTAAAFAQAIILCAPVVFRRSPKGFQTAGFFQWMRSGKERTRFNCESAIGDQLDAARNAQTVERACSKRFQYQEIEGSLQ